MEVLSVIEKIAADQAAADLNAESLEEGLDEIEEAATGPIALAMNVNEETTDESTSP